MIATRLELVILLWSRLIFRGISPELVRSITKRHGEDRRLLVPQPTKELTSLAAAMNAMLKDLQGAFEEQRKFTSDAAHELRTPVAIINGRCELSLSKPRDDAYNRASPLTCKQAATHMSSLVNKRLLHSRLDADSKRELTPTRLDAIVVIAIEMLGPHSTEPPLRFEYRYFQP